MFLNIEEYIEVNNTKLYVSIRAQNKNAPILLYLHGGPGDAALPLVLKYNQKLEEAYTVVILEQRGAGKSYYKFIEKDLTIDTFVEDIYQLSLILLKRYNQKKLYLVGHSWGSVLGMKLIKKHPDIIETYIGCGQVINMKKSSKSAYDFAWSKNKEDSNYKVVKRLESIDLSYTSHTWFRDLLFVTKQVVKYKGSYYGKKNYNHMIKDFLLSKTYSIKDLIHRQKGAKQSILYFWQELMLIDFENDISFDVPILFIEGRYDIHVDSKIVESYAKSIKSPVSIEWFESSCHFPQWSEAEKFNHTLISLLQDKR